MMLVDMLMVALLAAFILVWLCRNWERRRRALFILTTAIAANAVWGIAIDRWQAGGGILFGIVAFAVLAWLRWRHPNDRPARLPWISGFGWLALSLLILFPIYLFPVSPLPRPDGAFPVGVRTFELADPARRGVLGGAPGEPRRLLVRVWYPAGDVKGLTPRPYFSRAEANVTARALGAQFGFPPLLMHLRHVATNSYENAPLRPNTTQLPVLIYSHGLTTFLGQHMALMEELASRGYMVFAIQHAGDAADTLFPNGDVTPMDPAISLGEKPDKAQIALIAGRTPDERLNGLLTSRATALAHNDRVGVQSAREWVRDRLFVHDRLQSGEVPAGVADVVAAGRYDRVGEFGMSFGGATTGATCLIDKRCAAGINLDGVDLALAGVNREMPVPFLMFHSEIGNLYRLVGSTPPPNPRSYNEFSYERFDAIGQRPDIYRFQLSGTQHMGLSDFRLFIRAPLANPILGTASASTMIGAQRDFVRGFFDRYLRGRQNGFPSRQMTVWANVVRRVPNDDLRGWWEAKASADRQALADRIRAIGLHHQASVREH